MDNPDLYRSLLPVFVVAYMFLILFNYYALTWSKRPKSDKAIAKLHKSFIGIFMIEFWYWLINPVVKLCIRFRISPNSITLFSVFLSILAGYFYFSGNIALAGWLLLLTGTLDLTDGQLARESGMSSKAGAFLDSCSDRYAEGFVFLGVAFYFIVRDFDSSAGVYIVEPLYLGAAFFAVFAIIGSLIMSYVKARSEAVGITTKRGFMQRGERITILAFFSIIDPFWRLISAEQGGPVDGMFIVVVVLLSVIINFSALMRFIDLFRTIRSSESGK